MKIKLGKNLKKIKAFGIGLKGRSDDSIAASELLEEHLGKSDSKHGDVELDGADDDTKTNAETASDSRPTDNTAGEDANSVGQTNVDQTNVDEQSAERQDDDDHDDDASASTQVRLGRSISYVLREEERKERKQAKREASAAAAAAAAVGGRDEVESSGRPPLPRAQHRHSSSRTSSGSSSSGDSRQREGATGAATASDNGTKLSRDRSIRSRDKSIGSIEIKASQSVDNSVYDQQKTAEHGSKMVFEFDENGIQNVDLTKLSSSHDSDDSDRCPTVIMDDQTIEIVNSLSDSSVSNDHHQAKQTKKSASNGANKVDADTDTQQAPQYKITGADRIILRVTNTKKSIRFYSKLGFERIDRPAHLKKQQETEASDVDGAWLSNGKVVVHLIKGESEDEDLENIQTPTMGNISLYASQAEEAIALLQKTNVPFVANVRTVGSGIDKQSLRQAFIRDPDANYIEISNLNASNAAIKVSSEDSGTEQSKSVVVGNIMRRLVTEADLRPSFNEAELDLEFDDDVIDKAMDLMKSLSDSHMTTVPTNILNFINTHSREKSQQRLKSSRSTSYLDTARIEKKNLAGVEELISSNCDDVTPTLRDFLESVNHISLTVSDVNKSIKFYTDVIGLKEVNLPSASKVENVGSVIAGDIIINLVEGEPRAQNPLEGQVFLNASGMTTALKAFQEKKVPYRIHFAGDPAKSESNASLVEAFVSDPDGYVIVLGNYAEAAQGKCAIAGTSSSHIKPIPRQYQPTAVDSKVLRNFARRRKFEGDVCYQFSRNDLKKLLLQAGNDAPTALQLMKQHREKEAKKRVEKEVKLKEQKEAEEESNTSSLACCGCCY